MTIVATAVGSAVAFALVLVGLGNDSSGEMSLLRGSPEAERDTGLQSVLAVGSEEGLGQEGSTPYRIAIPNLASDGTVAPAVVNPTVFPTEMAELPIIVATPTPVPAPLSITDIICSFSWPCWEAISVARCESGLNSLAYNPSGAQGLFQLMPRWHAHRYNGGDWRDPWVNARAAHSLWLEDGWRQWVCQP